MREEQNGEPICRHGPGNGHNQNEYETVKENFRRWTELKRVTERRAEFIDGEGGVGGRRDSQKKLFGGVKPKRPHVLQSSLVHQISPKYKNRS
jgi:hypothetical protein